MLCLCVVRGLDGPGLVASEVGDALSVAIYPVFLLFKIGRIENDYEAIRCVRLPKPALVADRWMVRQKETSHRPTRMVYMGWKA